MSSFSIVVPTYNRSRTLLQSLRSFQEQTWPDFEILVVDNAADPEVARAVADFNREARIPARYVGHDAGGNSGARNRGAREAEGELLAYTDDDMTVHPEWLAAYAAQFAAHPEMVAAGGCIRLLWEQPPPQWLLDYMGDIKVFGILGLMEPSPKFTLSNEGTFWSGNMAIRRSVFDWAGFHPEMHGRKTIGDGESGLNQDIAKRGGLIGYVPDAIAYHHIPPHRMTVDQFRRWAWHLGGSEMYGRWRSRKRSIPWMIREALMIARDHWRDWVKDCFVRHRRDSEGIDIQFQASLGWCKLNYLWWMLTDPQVQRALDMTDFRP